MALARYGLLFVALLDDVGVGEYGEDCVVDAVDAEVFKVSS
jgi:hypothetical protein